MFGVQILGRYNRRRCCQRLATIETFLQRKLFCQARRQDSVTKGAEINFGGAREVYLCKFNRGTRAREVKKKVFVSKFPQIVAVVSKFLRFSSNSKVKTIKKKKRCLSQNLSEIRCKFAKSSSCSRIPGL